MISSSLGGSNPAAGNVTVLKSLATPSAKPSPTIVTQVVTTATNAANKVQIASKSSILTGQCTCLQRHPVFNDNLPLKAPIGVCYSAWSHRTTQLEYVRMCENQFEISVAQCEELISIKLNTFNVVMNGTRSYRVGATTDGVYYSNSDKIFAFKTSICEWT